MINDFNAVLQALEKLYEAYYPLDARDWILIADALRELMQAYSDWLN